MDSASKVQGYKNTRCHQRKISNVLFYLVFLALKLKSVLYKVTIQFSILAPIQILLWLYKKNIFAQPQYIQFVLWLNIGMATSVQGFAPPQNLKLN